MFLLRTKTRTGTRVPPANRKCIPLPPPFIPLGSDPILLPLFDLSRHLTYEIVLVFGTARFIIIILHGVLPPNPIDLHPNYGTEVLTPDKWVLEGCACEVCLVGGYETLLSASRKTIARLGKIIRNYNHFHFILYF